MVLPLTVAPRSFAWHETGTLLAELWRSYDLRADLTRRAFVSADGGVRFEVPAVQPIPDGVERPVDYLAQLPPVLGQHLIVLLRAGSAALGWWEGDTLIAHKAFRRYVTRGRGHAQTAHLRSRGKSRYGSRLRLQNAAKLLAEVVERQTQWVAAHGAPDLAFRGCATRQWAELAHATPTLPIPAERYRKIHFDLREPGHRELLRVRRALLGGKLGLA